MGPAGGGEAARSVRSREPGHTRGATWGDRQQPASDPHAAASSSHRNCTSAPLHGHDYRFDRALTRRPPFSPPPLRVDDLLLPCPPPPAPPRKEPYLGPVGSRLQRIQRSLGELNPLGPVALHVPRGRGGQQQLLGLEEATQRDAFGRDALARGSLGPRGPRESTRRRGVENSTHHGRRDRQTDRQTDWPQRTPFPRQQPRLVAAARSAPLHARISPRDAALRGRSATVRSDSRAS